MVRFSELDIGALRDAIILVDVDGTIVHDRGGEMEPHALATLRSLAEHAKVYLVSNSPDRARLKTFATSAGVSYLDTPYKKPDVRSALGLPRVPGQRLVVIGDKRLTDGRFAAKLNAEFIQVSRVRGTERSRIKLVYFLDDMAAYIALLRPSHWIKNLLVFAPLVFAQEALRMGLGLRALSAFAAFCFFASAAYVMNDLVDRHDDRKHPSKRNRPLAAGVVSTTGAYALLILLCSLGTLFFLLVPEAAFAIVGYALLNIAYSFVLKRVAVIDMLCVAIFYVLRITAGGLATGIPISPWIMLCTFFGALTLISGKRLAEYGHAHTRSVLGDYSERSLQMFLVASSTLAIVAYAIWSVIATHDPRMVYSTLFVVAALMRIINLTVTKPSEAETPELLVFKDTVIASTFVLWAGYVAIVLYAL